MNRDRQCQSSRPLINFGLARPKQRPGNRLFICKNRDAYFCELRPSTSMNRWVVQTTDILGRSPGIVVKEGDS